MQSEPVVFCRIAASFNNPVKSDQSMLSCLLQKAQKPRQQTLAPYQGRYTAKCRVA
jgi:hypothetical protein